MLNAVLTGLGFGLGAGVAATVCYLLYSVLVVPIILPRLMRDTLNGIQTAMEESVMPKDELL